MTPSPTNQPSTTEPSSRRAVPVNELLGALIDSLHEYAVVTLDTEGVVRSWNDGAARIFGHAPREAVGQGFGRLYDTADVDEGLPELELAIAVADGHVAHEGWRMRDDGTRFWATTDLVALRATDGRLSGFGMIIRDMTERRRGEELLSESEERYRLLVNSVADYAIFLLDQHGVVSSWNLGAERLKGYRSDEIIGRSFTLFYSQDDVRRGVPQALLRQALEHGRVETEGWRVRKDGSRFWASVVITALRNADGRHRGFAKVTKDLTERKRSEDALRGILTREREAAQQLRDLERLRGEVVAIVAHDLRAPLTVVQNLVHILREDWVELTDGERLDRIERIAGRAAAMSELVDDLFDVVRIEAGQLHTERRPFDAGSVAREAISDVFAVPDLERVVLSTDSAPVALGDSRRTREVIVNLLSNADKFSPPGSPIRIEVGRQDANVRVAVTDEGPGIARDQRHLLFHRFSRLDPGNATAGSGIGLFIAKSLVDSQGGQIGVDSAEGNGSTFWFTLPGAP